RGVGILAQYPAGTLWRTEGGETAEIEVPDRRDLYEIVADSFRSAIAGAGRPTVDGAAGLSALAGALAIAESASTGRTVRIADVA
ncbi:MAG: gfo/Idh/MocA family oxidoreductase, partial [bacterium]|nr:gfo/Idh/MocA family oxidoreductase [bacterium]